MAESYSRSSYNDGRTQLSRDGGTVLHVSRPDLYDGTVSLRIVNSRLLHDLAEDGRACAQFAEMLVERIAEAIDQHLRERQAK